MIVSGDLKGVVAMGDGSVEEHGQISPFFWTSMKAALKAVTEQVEAYELQLFELEKSGLLVRPSQSLVPPKRSQKSAEVVDFRTRRKK